MKIVRLNFRVLVICGLLIFSAVVAVVAQPNDPVNGDPDVPITGIEILIALGGFFGVRKFLTRKKSN